MSDAILWHNYSEDPPKDKKEYLIAYNRWEQSNEQRTKSDGKGSLIIDPSPQLLLRSISAYWGGKAFYNKPYGTANSGISDPDQWAELPLPKAAKCEVGGPNSDQSIFLKVLDRLSIIPEKYIRLDDGGIRIPLIGLFPRWICFDKEGNLTRTYL